jgi:1,4-dihydroxy-2-naphthoyl-CoA synthase
VPASPPAYAMGVVMSESNTVTVDIKDAIATVTFNRPAKRNAMSPALHLEMAETLEKLRYEKTSRVVVLTGAGEAFCAGMDLKQFFVELKDNPPEFDRIFRIATEWRSRTLRYYPKRSGVCGEGGGVRAFGDQLQALPRRQRLEVTRKPVAPA